MAEGRGLKLLLDENLSRRILPALVLRFPGSSHVVAQGLSAAGDEEVWTWARTHDFVIVTKDEDFHTLSDLHGHPPRVVRLALGNSSNEQVLQMLIRQADHLERAFADPQIGLVELVQAG